MCSALPMKASHVQLIEDESGARVAHYAVGLLLSRVSSKMRSRVNRGGRQAAIDMLGQEILPDFLGGQRDSAAEFSTWLEKLQLANPLEIANASVRSVATRTHVACGFLGPATERRKCASSTRLGRLEVLFLLRCILY
ncbi:unnamed protein product [Symbiodinium natans]|uniref:Uncharacterized protein n=1 Tax=Symbiodinium natans TaxID=878477 RepID=A0A812GT96_9DINO|nr:unnamed protein product [Symbiodinium natans]